MNAFFKMSWAWHTLSAKFQLLSIATIQSWQMLCGINSFANSSTEQHRLSLSTRRKFGSSMDVSWLISFNDAHSRHISVMVLWEGMFSASILLRKLSHSKLPMLPMKYEHLDETRKHFSPSFLFVDFVVNKYLTLFAECVWSVDWNEVWYE